MLHPIKLPTYDQKFEPILQFQRQFLMFLCNANTPLRPNRADFEAALFQQETGQWLYKWLQNQSKNKIIYYQLLCDLLDHIAAYPHLRTDIIQAFHHDIDFAQHFTDTNFAFSFRTLDPITQNLLKLLFVPFYDDIFYAGFPPTIAAFNRKQMLKFFWNTNSQLKVCPVCDGAEIERNGNDIRCQVDHFFPKTSYPFFSMYIKNLVAICLYCNTSYKGMKVPLVHTY